MPFVEEIKIAEKELKQRYYRTKPQNLFALLKYRNTQHEQQIEGFIRGGFSILKQTALEGLEPRDIAIANHVAFTALVCMIGEWGKLELASLLIDEFLYVTWASSHDEKPPDGVARHYELLTTSGDIAVAFAKLGFRAELSFMDSFLNWCTHRYQTSDFLLKVKYLKWLVESDANGARDYLASHDKGISFAVTALADLNDQSADSLIHAKMASSKNVIFHEVCKEALKRLKSQSAPPLPQNLMIRLFGIKTATEMALGYESDNQFVVRAQDNNLGDPEIGQVTETDDGNFND
jgi:hypothetical protein